MPEPDRQHADFSDYSQDDFEIAADAAFNGLRTGERLAPLVASLRSIADSIDSLMSRPDLPDGLRSRLKRFFDLRVQWAPPGFEPASIRLGALVSESDAADFEFGYRGAGQRERLIFASELGEIEVDISPTAMGGLFLIRCQIEPESADDSIEPGEAFLVHVGTSDGIQREQITRDGFFSLETKPGVFDLTIVSGNRAVRLPGIEVG